MAGGSVRSSGSRQADGAPPAWAAALRAERLRLGLTQAELAGRAGIAADTVRKYESGARRPGRTTIVRLLDALQVPQTTVRSVFHDLGFAAADTLFPPSTDPDYFFTQAQLERFVDTALWPVFVANNVFEITAANTAAQRLWGIDFAHEIGHRRRAETNFLALAAEHQFTTRIVNWPELVGVLVSALKAVPQSRSLLEQEGSLFAEVFATFAASDPSLIARLLALWETTPARSAKVRWTYPVVWREPGFEDVRFVGVVTTASEPDGLVFNDWIPADARSHGTLEAILASRPGAELGPRGRGSSTTN